MKPKPYSLTDEEHDLLQQALTAYKQSLERQGFHAGDERDLKHTAASALENELLWQQEYGARRPGPRAQGVRA